jgi:hypothetical protein
MKKVNSLLLEFASVLLRSNHVARDIVNVNHSLMRTAEKLGVSDHIPDCIRLGIPWATEGHVGADQIETAFIGLRSPTSSLIAE